MWTERLGATLERGSKGGQWFSLIDKVGQGENLQSATDQGLRNQGGAGVEGQTCEKYRRTAPARLVRRQEQINNGRETPPPVKRVWIPKLGRKELRALGLPTVEDRVVQTAVRNGIEPIFENIFAEPSYGFRPGRGAKDALRRGDHRLKAGKGWGVEADLKGYFDAIPQDKLLAAVAEHIRDGAGLDVLGKRLRQGVRESGKDWKPTETGTPQGAGVSPLLANSYLNPLDHSMAQAGKEMVRSADDFVIRCESQKEAEEGFETLRQWVAAAGLTLPPTKTRIVEASQKGGFDFLGFHCERGPRGPRQKSIDKFRETIREKTRRLNPRPMREIVEEVNRTLKGGVEYFRHSVKNVFVKQDQFVRQRLRTRERKRHKLPGRARGQDHPRWPNAYFAELGLISLALARDTASRSRRRDH